VGSVNRYVDFDHAFLPLNDRIASRWQNIDRAFYEDISLPPIVLYKVGEVYFVVDGHHRVSVPTAGPGVSSRRKCESVM